MKKSLLFALTGILLVFALEGAASLYWVSFFENGVKESIFNPSKIPGLRVELKKNLHTELQGLPFHTNSFGFTGKEISLQKPANTLRLIGLGDSLMMGIGVAEEENYLAVLEKKLNFRPSQKRFEILNLAVPGYNTTQEYMVLKEKALRLQPDFILLGYVGNDQAVSDPCLVSTPQFMPLQFLNLAAYKFYTGEKKEAFCKIAYVRRAYSKIPMRFTKAYEAILRTAKENQIPIVTILDSRYVGYPLKHSEIEEIGKKFEAKTINLFKVFRDLPETIPIPDAVSIQDEHNVKYEIKPGKTNYHPNAKWHRDTANVLYESVDFFSPKKTSIAFQ